MAIIPFIGRSDIHFYDYEDTDDVLRQPFPLGHDEVLSRLANAPWLKHVVDRDWPGRSSSPYINAYAAAARIVIFAAVLGSVHASDISVASGLPETFVLAVELALKHADWEHTVLPALSSSLKVAVAEPPSLKDEVTYFLMEFCGLQVNALDLLKAMGSALLRPPTQPPPTAKLIPLCVKLPRTSRDEFISPPEGI